MINLLFNMIKNNEFDNIYNFIIESTNNNNNIDLDIKDINYNYF